MSGNETQEREGRRGRGRGRGAVAIAVGSLLVVTPCVALSSSGAAAAEPVTLTEAQAKKQILSAAIATDKRLLAGGGVMKNSWGNVGPSFRWTRSDRAFRVDGRRDAIAHGSRTRGDFGVVTAGSLNLSLASLSACDYGVVPRNTRVWRGVFASRQADWGELKPTLNERRGLALIGKPSARYVIAKQPNRTAKAYLQENGWTGSVSYLKEHVTFDAATVTETSAGRRFHVEFHEDDPFGVMAPETGAFDLDLDANGTLIRYAATGELPGSSTEVIEDRWTATYARQVVAVPTAKNTVTYPALERGCTAAVAKHAPGSIAKSVAKAANAWAKNHDVPVSVRKVRWLAIQKNRTSSYDVNVRTTRVPRGAKLTGRHALLSHPYEWRVTVRDGKAVARKVR